MSPFASENLVSRDGFRRPVLRQPVFSPHSGWIWYLLPGFLPISAAASIGSVQSLSRFTAEGPLAHRASSPQGSSSNCCCLFTYHYWPINVRLSFPTPTNNNNNIGMKRACWSYLYEQFCIKCKNGIIERTGKLVPRLIRCYIVCVCFLPIHSGHQVRWTHQPGSHRISHPPSFCGACLNFSREKDSAIPFPRRLWRRILCTNDLIVLHPLGIFF